MLSLPIELLILAALVLANGVLAMAETAVVSARKTKLKKLADQGSTSAAHALALAEQPARFLSLVEFWLTLSGMIAGVLAGARLVGQVERKLQQWPALVPTADLIALGLVILGLSAFMLLFGELLPKRIGLAYPEKVASLLSRTMRTLAWLAAPLLMLFDFCTDQLAKLVRLRPRSAADAVADEDVRAL